MKPKKIALSLLVIAIMILATSSAHASEIAGNLSTVDVTSGDDVNGSLSGTVTPPDSDNNANHGGSSGGGSISPSANETGTPGDIGLSDQSHISSDGKALEASSNLFAFAGPTGGSVLGSETTSAQAQGLEGSRLGLTSSALDAGRGLTFWSWFWISWLLLILIAIAAYLYNRATEKEETKRIQY